MKTRKIIQKTLAFVILAVLLLLFLLPFIILLMNAFKTNAQIIASPISLPTSISFNNFKVAMEVMNYYGSFINSLFITLASVAVIILFSSMTAHYFVRNNTKYSKFFFMLMVASMIIPFQSIMIPLVSIYGMKLGWIQFMPQQTLIFMYIGFGAPLAVFMYHGFIKSIPLELEEAAKIDGCNQLQTFFKIVFPMMVPISVTIGILDVLWIWNDYLLPNLILQNAGSDKYTLPLAIRVFQGTFSSDYEKFLPAVLLVVLPILIIYIFVQRYIIQGVTQGSIK
jgi:raffinose/stachyose/melibiose transport system permease protein